MATTVFTVEHVILQDEEESEAILKPLVLAKSRRFMEEWSKFENLEEDKESFDILRNCAAIGLEKQFKGQVVGKVEKKDNETEKAFVARQEAAWTEWLEESLDMPTIHKILEVCGGLKFDDPNLVAAMEEMERRQRTQAGTA